MHTLYHYGYGNKSSLDLREHADALGARVVDTRFRAASRNPSWNKSALVKVFGDRYEARGEWLGNVLFKEGGIRIANPGLGIPHLLRLLDASPVIIFCACSDYRICHRREVIAMLTAQAPEVRVEALGARQEKPAVPQGRMFD